jgi:hypothetical protein
MADPKNVRAAIADIAQRPKNVTFDEIDWVVDQLGSYYAVNKRRARHGTLFRVRDQLFMVCTHNPGSKQVKSKYVKLFLDAMIELGWY